MTTIALVALGIVALFLFVQSLFSLYLMLYTWEHPERLKASSGPSTLLPPHLSFSVLLPARHEQAVIFETIMRVWKTNYPSELLEVVVVCHADDIGTIAEAQRAIGEIGSPNVRVETFSAEPINKPRGLNVGLQRTANQIVTIFDAEDDPDPDVFNIVNTVMLEERVGIVQSGVQLMNFKDRWFSVHNVLEYFFYFKSRLHFNAKWGMIPLGGNTVFIRRDLLEGIGGWDENCLTEDADIGVRLCALGESIRVVYDAQHVTREETPDSVVSFIRQRTRWSQGFLQVLRKGTWRSLAKPSQNLLAAYTFSYPILQALLTLLWPPTLVALFWIKVPVVVALTTFLPLYSLLLQLIVCEVGVFMFAREYKLRVPLLMPVSMAISFLPYQWLLGISAVRAVYRGMRNENSWEKTTHLGAHRQPEIIPSTAYQSFLEEVLGSLGGVEGGGLVTYDPVKGAFSIEASRGLPGEVANGTRRVTGEEILGWVAQKYLAIIITRGQLPDKFSKKLEQPTLRSSVILPTVRQSDDTVILSLSSNASNLNYRDLSQLRERMSAFSAAPMRNNSPRRSYRQRGKGPSSFSGPRGSR